MATYGELEGFSYGELDRLTYEQVASVSSEVWSLLRDLSSEDRAELLDGLKSGTLPPGLVAGAHRCSKAQGAALDLWTRYLPKNAGEAAAYISVVISLLTYLRSCDPAPPPQQPPPVTVIVVELPPEVQPKGPPTPQLDVSTELSDEDQGAK